MHALTNFRRRSTRGLEESTAGLGFQPDLGSGLQVLDCTLVRYFNSEIDQAAAMATARKEFDNALDDCGDSASPVGGRDGQFLYAGRFHSPAPAGGHHRGADSRDPGQKPGAVTNHSTAEAGMRI